MGYYMRYFCTHEEAVTVDIIEEALKGYDGAFSIDRETGELKHGEDLYGQLEILSSGDDDFKEAMEDFLKRVNSAAGDKDKVLECLNATKVILALHVIWGTREPEATVEKIGLIWDWMNKNRSGLLQADTEGFYSESGFVLEVE